MTTVVAKDAQTKQKLLVAVIFLELFRNNTINTQHVLNLGFKELQIFCTYSFDFYRRI